VKENIFSGLARRDLKQFGPPESEKKTPTRVFGLEKERKGRERGSEVVEPASKTTLGSISRSSKNLWTVPVWWGEEKLK